MNRLKNLFSQKKNILNIYTTAGFPNLKDTVGIVQELERVGADMIEIGMPFSDPLADGKTIQDSSQIAIKNGITLEIIFNQIEEIRKTVKIPIMLMGYFNQVFKYGIEKFLAKAQKVAVDGLIIPDLPLDIFQKKYKNLFEKYDLKLSFLITPQTNEDRIRLIAAESTAFLYIVSSYATTGGKADIQKSQIEYFEKIQKMNLNVPTLIGFGISNQKTFKTACQYANGAIIGSAFVKALKNGGEVKAAVRNFVESVKK